MEIIKTVNGEYLQEIGVFARRAADGTPLLSQPMFVKIPEAEAEAILEARRRRECEVKEGLESSVHEEIMPDEVCRELARMFGRYVQAERTAKMRCKRNG